MNSADSSQIKENSRNIAALTNTVTRLATIVETSEKQRADDRHDMRGIYESLKALNDKIADLTLIRQQINDLSGQVGGLRHDVKNIENGQGAIPLIKEKLVEVEKDILSLQTSVEDFKTFKDKHEGATGVVHVIIHLVWAVFGTGIISVGYYILSNYFQHPNTTTTYESKQVIGGE